MTTIERAYERLVAANPIPDPVRYAAMTEAGVDAAFREPVRDQSEDYPSRWSRVRASRPQWQVGVAVLLILLAAGGALLLTTGGGSDDTAAASPLEVVDTFFTRWNADDIEGTMALVHPDASINGGFQDAQDLRGLIEWTMEFDGTMETSCSTGLQTGQVTCEWAFVSSATDALGIGNPQRGAFAVADGLITGMSTPNYGALELQLGSFARDRDPSGYDRACSPDGVSPRSLAGFPFNRRCGQFLADLEAEFVASRTD